MTARHLNWRTPQGSVKRLVKKSIQVYPRLHMLAYYLRLSSIDCVCVASCVYGRTLDGDARGAARQTGGAAAGTSFERDTYTHTHTHTTASNV